MTNTQYTYASARVKALETTLLSETHVERLLGAKSVPEAFKVLQDTFLAPHLHEHEKSNLGKALDAAITETKRFLSSVAPDPELLDVLWLKYDFYNLRTIVKGTRAGWEPEQIAETCFATGKYTPEALLKAYEENTLNYLSRHLGKAADKMRTEENIAQIDITANIYYFKAIQEIAERKHDPFVHEFVKLLIDLFNVKTALRGIHLKDAGVTAPHIPGGRFQHKDLETEKQILEQFAALGGEEWWKAAIDEYKETGDHALIEKASDEYIIKFLKERSYTLSSPVPLFSYFTARKNNVQLVAGIITEKEAGLSEGEIRHIFRTPYR